MAAAQSLDRYVRSADDFVIHPRPQTPKQCPEAEPEDRRAPGHVRQIKRKLSRRKTIAPCELERLHLKSIRANQDQGRFPHDLATAGREPQPQARRCLESG